MTKSEKSGKLRKISKFENSELTESRKKLAKTHKILKLKNHLILNLGITQKNSEKLRKIRKTRKTKKKTQILEFEKLGKIRNP